MTRFTARLRKAGAGALALLVGVLCLAPPCSAEPAAPPTPARSLTTLSPASQSLLRATTAAAATQDAADSKTFFKSRKGAAVLVLIGVGFGYTLYSKSHDRVTSPVR